MISLTIHGRHVLILAPFWLCIRAVLNMVHFRIELENRRPRHLRYINHPIFIHIYVYFSYGISVFFNTSRSKFLLIYFSLFIFVFDRSSCLPLRAFSKTWAEWRMICICMHPFVFFCCIVFLLYCLGCSLRPRRVSQRQQSLQGGHRGSWGSAGAPAGCRELLC